MLLRSSVHEEIRVRKAGVEVRKRVNKGGGR